MEVSETIPMVERWYTMEIIIFGSSMQITGFRVVYKLIYYFRKLYFPSEYFLSLRTWNTVEVLY